MDPENVKSLRCKLSLHLAAIACLTSMLVATGTGTMFLPTFMFCVCIVAYVSVDRMEWFELGQITAAVGMVAATTVAVASWAYSTMQADSQAGQLLAVAGLLVYPEAVLFLQRKNLRIFEQLAIFLLLEMVVAALVNDNLLFGLLLAPIMLMWVSSLFLFSRYATLVKIDPTIERSTPTLVEVLFAKLRKSVMGDAKPEVVATKLLPSREVLRSPWVRRSLQSFPIGMGALVFAGVFFYLTPRTNPVSLGASFNTQTSVGLPDFLSFGQFGRLLQNQTSIMRVAFINAKDDEPFCPSSPPYLRAQVFDDYVAKDFDRPFEREWQFQGFPNRGGGIRADELERPTSLSELTSFGRESVEIQFDIKQAYGDRLYSIPPALAVSETQRIPLRYDRLHMLFRRLDEAARAREKSIKYSFATTGFFAAEQSPITPVSFSESQPVERQLEILESRLLRGFRMLTRADDYRLQIMKRLRLRETQKLELARGLEEFLAYSGEFAYSLDLRPPSDSDIDVVEDFLINQRQGHCQYFASALACLLRQSEIPCRLVIGYRPSEYNKLGDYFLVRQKDAHAWVEALLHRSDIEGTEYESFLRDEEYYWVRLDPTPPSVGQPAEITEQSGQAMDYAEKLWKDYVVDGQQLSATSRLYDPVTESDSSFAALIEQIKRLSSQIQSGQFRFSVGFAWQVFFAIVGLGVFIIAATYFFRMLPRFAPRLAKRLGLMDSPSQLKHPFFVRCMALVSKLGLDRKASETPQEHVSEAIRVLKEKGQSDQGALNFLTSLYYRLRFGDTEQMSSSEAKQIEHQLELVDKVVQQATRGQES